MAQRTVWLRPNWPSDHRAQGKASAQLPKLPPTPLASDPYGPAPKPLAHGEGGAPFGPPLCVPVSAQPEDNPACSSARLAKSRPRSS